MTPKRANVRFYPTAAAAQQAGFRACKRCRPDAAPGSPEWNVRADVVGRAMRLIADGVVDRDGVQGLATRLGYSERHLHRQLRRRGRRRSARAGTGAAGADRAGARSRRRTLPFSQIAFGGRLLEHPPVQRHRPRGVRGDTDGAPAGRPPAGRHADRRRDRHRRRRRDRVAAPRPPAVRRRRAARPSSAAGRPRRRGAAPATTYRRTLRLPHGHGIVELAPRPDHVAAASGSTDLRDLTHGGPALPPTARPRRRPGRRRRGAGRRPAARPTGGEGAGPAGRPGTSTGPSWRCGPCSASRSRSARPAPHTARLVAAARRAARRHPTAG